MMNETIKTIIAAAILSFTVTVFLLSIILHHKETKQICKESRDLEYEYYCDSIYIANPNYYYDVLVETYEYQQYIEKHGVWWKK